MWRRFVLSAAACALVTGVLDSPSASAQQTVNFFVGGFVPRGFSSRGVDDVLFQDADFLLFNIRDFNGPTVGGEYLTALGDFFEAGVSVGYYSRSALAFDADFVRPNGNEIVSELRLRVVPVTATFRYLPIGHHDAFEPYVGAGVGVLNWRYIEEGSFADSRGNITDGSFRANDTTVGPVILGGARFPVGAARIGGEIRYQGGKGDLPPALDFAGPRINLGGFNYLFTVGVRF